MSPENSQVEKREKATLPQTDEKIDAELFSQCFSESLGHDLSFYEDKPSTEPIAIQTSENDSAPESKLQEETSSEEASENDKVNEEESNSAPTNSGSDTETTPEIPKLRIIFAGMDGRFSTTALQVLAGAHKIVGIIHSQPRRTGRGLLERWLRAGKGAGNLEKFAKYYGCPFFSTQREYNHELLRFIKHLKPDLICISNFSIINVVLILGFGCFMMVAQKMNM